MYYQPGGNTLVYVLTESGNIYTNEVFAINQRIDSINNFKKSKYSNVEGIIKVNTDKSNTNEDDGMPYYYAAVINGKTVSIDFN